MNALFDAIYLRWASEMGSRVLYNTEAPGEAPFPYSVMSLVSDVGEWTFGETFENCLIQFNLFSDESLCTEVGLIFEALKEAFDYFDLVVVGYDTVSLIRQVANLLKIEGVWQYNISYRIVIQNN